MSYCPRGTHRCGWFKVNWELQVVQDQVAGSTWSDLLNLDLAPYLWGAPRRGRGLHIFVRGLALPMNWFQILFSALRKKDKITRFHFSKIEKYFSKIDFDAEKLLNSKIDFSLFRHFLSWNENCQLYSSGLQNFLSNSLT